MIIHVKYIGLRCLWWIYYLMPSFPSLLLFVGLIAQDMAGVHVWGKMLWMKVIVIWVWVSNTFGDAHLLSFHRQFSGGWRMRLALARALFTKYVWRETTHTCVTCACMYIIMLFCKLTYILTLHTGQTYSHLMVSTCTSYIQLFPLMFFVPLHQHSFWSLLPVLSTCTHTHNYTCLTFDPTQWGQRSNTRY